MIDDFREAYWWLRDNTPEDSRVMAWWDYGYQINGVANRTSIADGNTWNHEHIALLGRALVSPEKKVLLTGIVVEEEERKSAKKGGSSSDNHGRQFVSPLSFPPALFTFFFRFV
jgi:asparagine N-glycosylation enzyme membrane subunit Stt3